jgi:phosphoglucan, water dikinase
VAEFARRRSCCGGGGLSRLTRAHTKHTTHTQQPDAAPAAPAATPPQPPQPTTLTLTVTKRVAFGQAVKAVGAHPALGAWDVAAAPAGTWAPGDVWSVEVAAPVSGPFKLVVVGGGDGDGGDAEWEAGPDRELPEGAGLAALEWGVTTAAAVVVAEAAAGAPSRAPTPTPNLPSTAATAAWVGPAPVFMQANAHRADRASLGLTWDTSALPPGGPAAALVAGDADAPSWLDKVRLVARVVADGDLSAVGGPPPDKATPPGARRPSLDALACAYVYLTLVARGALPCVEAGGHARPNHAAAAGLKIFRTLEWTAGDAARCDAATRAMALRLHARLPSFDGAFTQATPLTRVRDLAHRNDISQHLKREIKHTIQNKLHRCAGPEDLVATEALLARFIDSAGKGGDYDVPPSFLAEFQTFAAELRAFFNAAGLEEALAALGPSLDDAGRAAIARLLGAKAAADAVAGVDPAVLAAAQGEDVRVKGESEGAGAPSLSTSPLDAALNAAAEALHAATSLRAHLARGLASGLRTDAPDASLAMRQAWRVADVRTEEFVFVTLSWALNLCDASWFGNGSANGNGDSRGAAALARSPDDRWGVPLGLVLLAVRNVGLSGWAPPAECLAVENELAAWVAGGAFSTSRPAALRLRASLERAGRLAGTVCDGLTAALADRADALGAALGVPHRTAGFAEAEVRASVAFQLAKAAAFCCRAARGAAAAASNGPPDSPWSTLVPGSATGTLIEVAHLADAPAAAARAGGGPVVVLARRATGDEEVGSAAGPGGSAIAAVLLLQDIPHLSHLGVRARQVRLPFAACADIGGGCEDDGVDRALVGQAVSVAIAADGTVAVTAGGSGRAAPPPSPGLPTPAPPPPVVDMRATAPVPLADARPETCGPKASACGGLLRAAAASAGAFTAPPGFVLPFGALPAAAQAAGVGRDLAAALADLDAAAAAAVVEGCDPAASADLDAAAARVRAIVAALRPDTAALAAAVASSFPAGSSIDAVAVRSSAAAEDLAGAAAAGLYDSVLGVPVSDGGGLEALAAAVGEVWASLFSRRAVLARAAAAGASSAPQASAAMAVLVQAQAPAALSFILHTADPGGAGPGVLAAEVAVGAGEALASGGVAGSPWRLAVGKGEGGGDATLRSFANLSSALLPAPQRGRNTASSTLTWRTVEYSRHPLSCDAGAVRAVGRALAAAGAALEARAGGVPQDAEGCFGPEALAALAEGSATKVVPVIVQTRPQPGAE